MDANKQQAGTPGPAPKLDVLIIDGEGPFAETCRQALERGGYRASIAQSGPEGLQRAGEAHPGVAILDLNMPGMAGLEALRMISSGALSIVPIVMATEATVDAAVESMKLGAFDFLTKPVATEKLLETVRRALEFSTLRQGARGSAAAGARTPPPDKYDLLLQGLDVLGEAYTIGMGKRQLLDELTSLENEAKHPAEGQGQSMRKDRAVLGLRDDLMKADAIMRQYDFRKDALIQILLDVQEEFRWLPPHILNWISGRLNIPLREISTIAHFYEAFSTEPRGRHIFQVCTGTACHVRGASELLTRVSSALGIQAGQTDSKMTYTLETVHCLGCCALAPVVQVDSEYYQDPSRSKLETIIKPMQKEEANA